MTDKEIRSHAKSLGVNHNGTRGMGPFLADVVMGMAADVVDDLESVRIANQNRLRQLTSQGEMGHGLTLDHPDVKNLQSLVEKLEEAENDAIKNLQRVTRRHPLWAAFGKDAIGVGEKQLARLLAVIGDPYWNEKIIPETEQSVNRPRTRAELAAYCGVHVVNGLAPTRRRGVKGNWNETARKRLWLIASKTIMFRNSPYRTVYDNARLKYQDAVHAQDCVRCGPKGKPALVGTPLSSGHQHARAIRLVMHQILDDLWEVSRRLHEEAESTPTPKAVA